jgi:hypothetical protein
MVYEDNLRHGASRSCGCLRKEKSKFKGAHGHASHLSGRSPTFISWSSMVSRCTNSKQNSYALYGGAGITICERWHSFANFLSDMGERPAGLTLDRINPSGNYEPSNCRWADWFTQGGNRKNNVVISLEGQNLHLAEVGRRLGIEPANIRRQAKYNKKDIQEIVDKLVLRKKRIEEI